MRPAPSLVGDANARRRECLEVALVVTGVHSVGAATDGSSRGRSRRRLLLAVIARRDCAIGDGIDEGPRVVEQFLGHSLPPGSHSAEFLFSHGLIDKIVNRMQMRDNLGAVLDLLVPRDKVALKTSSAGVASNTTAVDRPVWDTVQIARAEDRLTSSDYINS